MSQPTTSTTLPPEYSADAANVQETIPPETLRFAGRFIHSANSANADSAGLYEINHQLDFLRETDRKVEFNRINYTFKRRPNNPASDPDIVATPKQVFTIERPPPVVQDPFAFYLWPSSRSSFGTLAVRFAKIGKSVCKAWRVRRKPKSVSEYEARELVFDVRPNNQVLDWLDGNGERIAVEELKDDMRSLNIMVPMERAQRDALVATWCSRLWEKQAVLFHHKRTWRDSEDSFWTKQAQLANLDAGKHIMETCTAGLPGRGGP
ncbi:hypothetical protein C8034_v007723 [Colletotrichum sidae]|uniref:Uncharacterized protein n=1 Tax=Colletotrichum sidae TaxID=1347389 RepID=A0A4R8TRS4_9PEZI|nr:hypothetical protein C8034_v007723 [Colletotrichum sidae]